MDSSNLPDIIFFAALAGFLIYRLRSALGRKDYSDDVSESNFSRFKDGLAEKLKKPSKDAIPAGAPIIEASVSPKLPEVEITDQSIASAIEDFKKIDRNFSATYFLEGAKGAFEMILAALSKGDKQALSNLLSKEAYAEFENEVEARNQPGKKHETTLVAVSAADITKAELQGKNALITVQFISEQIDVARNEKGEIIEGNPSQSISIKDSWVFSRDLSSPNPNWKLVEVAA